MFTAVGHVGLHLVLRPLIRWGIRSWIMPAKEYIDTDNNGIDDKNGNFLESESQIESELEENKKKKKSKRGKSVRNLANVSSGLAGPYSELVCTFGALAGISYVAYPTDILLYFGVSYPSMPFILRFLHSLNDKKTKITLSRTVRLCSKAFIVTAGFGASMILVGVLLQSIPFFNIFCLAFWDCFADFILSDGPNK